MIKTRKAFSLIEIIVVMSIISFLALITYVPFSYYSNIASTKNWVSKLNQAVNEAKFLAYGGYVNKNWNSSNIWLYLEKWKSDFAIIAYPYNLKYSELKAPDKIKELNDKNKNFKEWEIAREDSFDKNLSITDFSWISSDSLMLFFKTINWQMVVLKKNNSDEFEELSSSWVEITIWFKWQKTGNLAKRFFISK